MSLIKRKNYDYTFFFIVFVLIVYGFVVLFSASSDLAKQKYGDAYYYLKHQILFGLLPGIFGFILGWKINYEFWRKISLYLLILAFILLLLVFTGFGVKAYGAKRWLDFGGINFQPAEFAKFALVNYTAAYLAKVSKRKEAKSFSQIFYPFLFVVFMITIPIFAQPATTTPIIIITTAFLLYFVARIRYDWKKLLFVAIIIPLIVAFFVFLVFKEEYKFKRINAFLNPEEDTLGQNFHLNQSKIAIGSGGLFGVGYGKSTTKLFYLPEPIGDSIFAVIGEEFGFIGSIALIFFFLVFIWRGLKIAKNSKDYFARFFTTGFVSLVGIQAFIHIASVSGMIFYTGIPLPFISYGGTALFVFLTMSGIVLNISGNTSSRI
jgi:cell division protein FtsW